MSDSSLSRRSFNQLTMAAMGGLVVGSSVGAVADDEPKEEKKKEVHVCRGLNSCKGQDASGKAACAGQGVCATAKAHTCAGQNACKGQGGCGTSTGANACKGHGECAVPLSNKAWKGARAAFEAKMTKAGKAFGPAPPKANKKKES